MKNGFKILWTDHALSELETTFEYLAQNWTSKEITRLVLKIEHIVELISKNPEMYQVSEKGKDIRQAVIMKHNTMYYRIIDDSIQILSFFSNRQESSRRKF